MKVLSDSTLKSMKKDELIKLIRILEYNNKEAVDKVTYDIFSQLAEKIYYEGHTISVWKNELIKIANKFGYTINGYNELLPLEDKKK